MNIEVILQIKVELDMKYLFSNEKSKVLYLGLCTPRSREHFAFLFIPEQCIFKVDLKVYRKYFKFELSFKCK